MDNNLIERRHQLERGFASDNWYSLTLTQKLELCREIENNYASEHHVRPCYVTCDYMEGTTYGYQSNSTIVLNQYILEDGRIHAFLRDQDKNIIMDNYGQPIETSQEVPASNWATLETLYHEGTHGIQEAENRSAYTYIEPNTDYSLYRIQGDEREAFENGQQRTIAAIRAYELETGTTDPNTKTYLLSVEENNYEQYRNDAAFRFNDPEIENTLDQYISDKDNGIIHDDPTPSYQAISDLYDRQQNGISYYNENQDYISSDQTAEGFVLTDNNSYAEESGTSSGYSNEYYNDSSYSSTSSDSSYSASSSASTDSSNVSSSDGESTSEGTGVE